MTNDTSSVLVRKITDGKCEVTNSLESASVARNASYAKAIGSSEALSNAVKTGLNGSVASLNSIPILKCYEKEDTPDLQGKIWSMEVPEEVLIMLDKRDIKRQEIIFETVQTEQNYVRDLKTLKAVFIDRLQASDVVSRFELDGIFANVLDLLPVHEKMLYHMTNRQRESAVVHRIADIFADVLPIFEKRYATYVQNRKNATSLIAKLMKNKKKFKELIKDCSEDPRCKKLDMESFLAAPFHRITKYPLLLRNLQKVTPEDNPDFETLTTILEHLDTIVSISNEMTSFTSSIQKLVELQSRLVLTETDSNVPRDWTLVTSSRRLIFDATANVWKVNLLEPKKFSEVQIFLLNDMLCMFRELKKGDKVTLFADPLDLNKVIARDPATGVEHMVNRSLATAKSSVPNDSRKANRATLPSNKLAKVLGLADEEGEGNEHTDGGRSKRDRVRSVSENDMAINNQTRERFASSTRMSNLSPKILRNFGRSDKAPITGKKQHVFVIEHVISALERTTFEIVVDTEFDKSLWMKNLRDSMQRLRRSQHASQKSLQETEAEHSNEDSDAQQLSDPATDVGNSLESLDDQSIDATPV
eukprot:Clim_evm30s232 gene=Clim_evmTU30s232